MRIIIKYLISLIVFLQFAVGFNANQCELIHINQQLEHHNHSVKKIINHDNKNQHNCNYCQFCQMCLDIINFNVNIQSLIFSKLEKIQYSKTFKSYLSQNLIKPPIFS